MSITAKGWKNKVGTSNRSCKCGSWKQHWINCSGLPWPMECSIENCHNQATLGAHIYNVDKNISGEYIVPACDSCNKKANEFSLKGGIRLVSANKQESCEK